MSTRYVSLKLILLFVLTGCAATTTPVDNLDDFFSVDGATVTNASYPTDETSRQMLKTQDHVGVNNFLHKRQLTPTDDQPVVRLNRDTYYTFAVVDVSKGATVTIPKVPEGKYMSVQPVTEDHRIQPMFYGAGTFELSTHIGSHLHLVIRLDATFTEAEAAKLQDQMVIKAKSNNPFKTVAVNQESFRAVEDKLKAQMPAIIKRDGINSITGMFTSPADKSNELFTQEKYEVGAAVGWGGAQIIDNIYEISGNFPADTCHKATFKDPKNKAFWSITVYNKAGFMFNDLANLSSNTTTPDADGTYTISFGCGDKVPNNIETANDSGVFNLGIRHYQPSDLISVDGYRIVPTIKAINTVDSSSAETLIKQPFPVDFQKYGMTPEQYVRFESDINFDFYAQKQPAINELIHLKKPVAVAEQVVVRSNNDTLYSIGVVDARKGFTITLPSTGSRYLSAYVINQDHYPEEVFYGEGTYDVKADTDYVFIVVRTQMDPSDEADVATVVNSIQPQINIKSNSAIPYVMPKFNKEKVVALRAELDKEMAKIGSFDGTMDVKGKVDPFLHVLGASSGWGLLPSRDASYTTDPVNLPAKGCYQATYAKPPVDGFWSITMYDKGAFLFADTHGILNGYNVNYNEDGSFTAHFGSAEDCGDVNNRLEITEGWNYLMRFYKPRLDELKGYQLPEIKKIK